MAALRSILEQVKKELRPEKKVLPEVDALIKKITSLLKKHKINATVKAGGSYRKGTFLKELHDIDVFVAFSLTYKEENLSDLLEKVLAPLKPERVHGSRDYFHIHSTYAIEIVPVLDIKKPEQAQNVTDFSLWHVKWVLQHAKGKEDDIRLAKQFCKVAGVYGAESYLAGFSGHVLDILIIHYGSFEKLLKASSTWKAQQVIDPAKHHKGKALFNLNKSKTQSGLVVVDPVQPDRNAAAALSVAQMKTFQKQAKAFLKQPDASFFTPKTLDLAALRKKKALIIKATAKKGKKDIAGAKAVKAYEYLRDSLSEEFGVRSSGWSWENDFIMWFIPEKNKLPPMKEHKGPPLDKKSHVALFRKKYKNATTKKGHVVANVKRPYTTPEQLIAALLNETYVKSRVQKIQVLP